MRYQVKQRMDFIAATLEAKRQINRQDLIGQFGISPAQASIDLNQFIVSNPDAMYYCLSRKAYFARPQETITNPTGE